MRDYAELWEHAPSGQLLLDDDGLVTAVNATFTTWTGHAAADLVGTPFPQLLPIGDRVLYTTHSLPQLLVTGRIAEASVQVTGADGRRHPALLSATRVQTAGSGAETRVVLVDAQERRRYEEELLSARRRAEESQARIAQAEAELTALVHHDSLTGLLNRPGLLHALHGRLGAARTDRADGAVPTVFFLDLDGFKTVNDALGHTSGDELLQVVARRVRSAARAGADVARFAGDEFVVLDDVLPSTAGRLADRLLELLAEPVVLQGVELVVAASVGICAAEVPVPPSDVPDTADLLLRRADTAMYRAKAQGSGRWDAHRPGSSDPGAERLVLLEQLRAAVRDGELRVHYQPRQHLPSGTLSGVEALVRWQHPTRGLLQPAEFIDAAEESGVIRDLGAWVLTEAVEQAVRWDAAGGLPGLQMAVNLSARQLADPGLVPRVAGTLARAGLRASRLVLEITETALMSDPEAALATLQELRALGVLLAVDDFGTGYSSFTYLKQFPVDELKIDRSFVTGMTTDAGDRAIVASCVHLAHAMGLVAVAEGVETAAERDALRALGCDQAQGYFFSRPVPPSEVPVPGVVVPA
ncbi:putative bifunctional diguanylate cyclase/phosphodiesterase [Modestobacter versicolor]|uniref:Diguanylate cyclase (GGDEF)-like protein/PAS domain S-box-containing protein n=1 Tax=Modestobacter versicolor TaxID=429133 RepID=A0A323VBB9_9ACTN|nr:GGDEF domain-containing phosphodiesterase [Modestobacter versicolor]MBB3677935.1 diguanylate cyclase (GGDEF)-like protein/PAS domain S-box-containing protein [Modestobacter versicolor]PZA22124.1 GGDEF domain-containing protein [Modestobacter versicolor]